MRARAGLQALQPAECVLCALASRRLAIVLAGRADFRARSRSAPRRMPARVSTSPRAPSAPGQSSAACPPPASPRETAVARSSAAIARSHASGQSPKPAAAPRRTPERDLVLFPRQSRAALAAWRVDYNGTRPHSALGNIPPPNLPRRSGLHRRPPDHPKSTQDSTIPRMRKGSQVRWAAHDASYAAVVPKGIGVNVTMPPWGIRSIGRRARAEGLSLMPDSRDKSRYRPDLIFASISTLARSDTLAELISTCRPILIPARRNAALL